MAALALVALVLYLVWDLTRTTIESITCPHRKDNHCHPCADNNYCEQWHQEHQ